MQLQSGCLLASVITASLHRTTLHPHVPLRRSSIDKVPRIKASMEIELGRPYIEDSGNYTISCGTASVPRKHRNTTSRNVEAPFY